MRSAERPCGVALGFLLLAMMLSGCHLFAREKATPLATAAVPAAPAELPQAVRGAYTVALTAMQASDWLKAESALQTLIDANPELPGPVVNLGLVYQHLKRPDDARKLFERAVERWPDFAPAQHQLGRQLRDDGKFEAADAAFARAQAANPDYALAYYDRAVLNELYLQRLPQALENYMQFQRLQTREDAQVARWIVDLQRRTSAPAVARPTTTGKPS